jgi:hypothetical protein
MSLQSTIRTYRIINICLAGIILAIFLYSAIYSPVRVDHPIPSLFEKITQQKSPSSGLSRAFSELIRGNFDNAIALNSRIYYIAFFFIFQLFLRLIINLKISVLLKIERIIIIDLLLSITSFIYCFKEFICFLLSLFIHIYI